MSPIKKTFTFVEAREAAGLALQSVRAHKFRSSMTILGVMIGVCAVILINTIMDGFTSYVEASIDKIGFNVLYIAKYAEHTDWENMTDEERLRKNITMDEALAIQNSCDQVRAVSPQKIHFDNEAKYGAKIARNPDDTRGVWPEFTLVASRDVEYGRFIDDGDLERAGMVVVLGPEIADALFDTRAEAIDKEIRVNGHRFTVIGVLDEVEDLFNISENDYVLMPMSAFDNLYPGVTEVELVASAKSRDVFALAYDQVVNALRRVRGVPFNAENNFAIYTQDRFKDQMGSITTTVQLSAVAVASVGLLVGLVGVMNIMLVSVTERTREIGIRKAIGARRINIMFQFLTEAMTLTGMGGLTGIIFGALVGLGVTSLLEWKYYLSPLWIFIGLALSTGTGLAAGLYPAWKASRLDPIDALRYE